MNAAIMPTPIIGLPDVPRTRVVHMSRVLLPESKGEPAEELQAAILLRSDSEPQVWLREDFEAQP